MNALLVVAHGSRRARSNDEIRALTRELRERNQIFDFVECAFLELEDPLIPDGIRRLIDQGAGRVVVMPYFLSAGRHVAEDIPKAIKIVADEYPDVEIRQAPYVGASPGIPDLILHQAADSF